MSGAADETSTEVNGRKRISKKAANTPHSYYDDVNEDNDGPLNSGLSTEAIARKEQGTGTETLKPKKKSVLEQHCGFFDRDGDGVIWPRETYQTCREFDWGIPLSLFFAVFLHAVQSWGTVPWRHGLPDPFMRIWLENVHFNKHGSSTMAFNNEGIFRPQFMDEFFEKFDRDGKGGLTFGEGLHGLRRIRMTWDPFGQASAMFEWGFTYVLLWPEDGVVRHKDARRVLDGSIFHEKVKAKARYSKPNINADYSKAG